jgi:hypothetical protein
LPFATQCFQFQLVPRLPGRVETARNENMRATRLFSQITPITLGGGEFGDTRQALGTI